MTAADPAGYGPDPAVAQLKQAEHDARITYLTTCDQAQRRYQAASQTAWDTYQLTEMQAWDTYLRAVNTARGTYRDLPPAPATPPPPPPPGDHPYPPAGTGGPPPPLERVTPGPAAQAKANEYADQTGMPHPYPAFTPQPPETF